MEPTREQPSEHLNKGCVGSNSFLAYEEHAVNGSLLMAHSPG